VQCRMMQVTYTLPQARLALPGSDKSVYWSIRRQFYTEGSSTDMCQDRQRTVPAGFRARNRLTQK
jgi:hypothetical protein